MCNVEWRLKFGEAIVKVLPRVFSDHHPILINLKGGAVNKEDRRFRLKVTWLTHKNFESLLLNEWQQNLDVNVSLNNLIPVPKEWNRLVFDHIKKKKRILMARINCI